MQLYRIMYALATSPATPHSLLCTVRVNIELRRDSSRTQCPDSQSAALQSEITPAQMEERVGALSNTPLDVLHLLVAIAHAQSVSISSV